MLVLLVAGGRLIAFDTAPGWRYLLLLDLSIVGLVLLRLLIHGGGSRRLRSC